MRLATADVAVDEGNHSFSFANGIHNGPDRLDLLHLLRGNRQSFNPLLTGLQPMVSR